MTMMKMIGVHSVPVQAPFQPSHLERLNHPAVHHPDHLLLPPAEAPLPAVVKDLLPEVEDHPLAEQHLVHQVVLRPVDLRAHPALPNLR